MLDNIIAIFEEVLERDNGTIKPNDQFRDYDEWDSLAYLAVIAAIDDEYEIVIPVADFRACKTIQEVAKYVELHK